jgi:DNA polymerase III subunit beta
MSKVKERPTEQQSPVEVDEQEAAKQPASEEALAQTIARKDADKPIATASPAETDEALTSEAQAESGAADPTQSMATTAETQAASKQEAAAEEEIAISVAPEPAASALAISCLVPNLKSALAVVNKAVATKTTMPILGCVLLETERGRLKLVATNLEVGITRWVDCQIHSEGAVAVPAKLFADFVADLPADKLEMRLDPHHILHLECGRFIANIKCLPAEDFPLVPTYQSQQVLAMVESEALRAAIDEVEFAAARDNSRPVLTGVLMRFTLGQMTMAGTDGFRLAERKLSVVGISDNPPIIVPARAIRELSSILERGRDEVIIAATPNRNQALFHVPDLDLVARLIDGPYPNYGQIIPDSHKSRMVMTTQELHHAIKMAETFARDSMHIVKLMIAPGGEDGGGVMTIIAHAAEAGDNKSELDGLLEGEGVQIAFNAKLVLDVLGTITTPLVALETNTSTSPGVLRPVGQEEGNTGIYVIMPMNLFK